MNTENIDDITVESLNKLEHDTAFLRQELDVWEMEANIARTAFAYQRDIGDATFLGEHAQNVGLARKVTAPFRSLLQLFKRSPTETARPHAKEMAYYPRISIIVVTYNNVHLTRECLRSLEEQTSYDNLEIIVVDNASSDGTPEFLRQWEAKGKDRFVLLNNDNRGFAAANNQGLRIASGDYLVLLNNDTVVTPHWAETLMRHLQRNRRIGLIGPITNSIGNEAKLEGLENITLEEGLKKAVAYTSVRKGYLIPICTLAFFCVMLRRSVFEAIGFLDEEFGRGWFEDDDYCRRVEQMGLHVVFAEDVFVWHSHSASFNALQLKIREELFANNLKIYESKWGKWTPHISRRKRFLGRD